MTIHSAGAAATSAAGRMTEIRNWVSPGRMARATTASGREPSNSAVNHSSVHQQDDGTSADQGDEDKACVGNFWTQTAMEGSIKFARSISFAQATHPNTIVPTAAAAQTAQWLFCLLCGSAALASGDECDEDRLKSTGHSHERSSVTATISMTDRLCAVGLRARKIICPAVSRNISTSEYSPGEATEAWRTFAECPPLSARLRSDSRR